MTHTKENLDRDRFHETGRINLNTNAWRRLCELYADQRISPVLKLQYYFAGAWFSALERLAYGLSNAPTVLPDLVFVIGHWRSGTTFLHEMLCMNPCFNFPTTYACMNPQVFPITEATILRRSGDQSVLRPMDKMSISLASPQEDEFALLALGAPSPYEGLLFPRVSERGMAVADPDDLPETQQQEWIRVFIRFLCQVATRKPGCPVILKSPTHSYRVKLLLRLFPNARFVHVVRNPLEVYSSTVNMWQTLYSLYALTDLPNKDVLIRRVIDNWISLEEKLDAAIPSLGKNNYVQITYESLTTHPVREMERIYTKLKLDGFSMALPHIQSYLTSRVHFEKNRFDLAPDSAKSIFLAWRHIFDKYGYPAPTLPS